MKAEELLYRVVKVLEPPEYLSTWAIEQDRKEIADDIRSYLSNQAEMRRITISNAREQGFGSKMVDWVKQRFR